MKAENIRLGQIVRLNNPQLFHGNGIYFISDKRILKQLRKHSSHVTIVFTDASIQGQWCGSTVVNALLNHFDQEHGLDNCFPYIDYTKFKEI